MHIELMAHIRTGEARSRICVKAKLRTHKMCPQISCSAGRTVRRPLVVRMCAIPHFVGMDFLSVADRNFRNGYRPSIISPLFQRVAEKEKAHTISNSP